MMIEDGADAMVPTVRSDHNFPATLGNARAKAFIGKQLIHPGGQFLYAFKAHATNALFEDLEEIRSPLVEKQPTASRNLEGAAGNQVPRGDEPETDFRA
jgi:hypothetical protein